MACLLAGCGSMASPLAPDSPAPPPERTPVARFPVRPAPLGPLTPPPNGWWRGGFLCGFPEAPACRFSPGYQWETAEAYCADHPEAQECSRD